MGINLKKISRTNERLRDFLVNPNQPGYTVIRHPNFLSKPITCQSGLHKDLQFKRINGILSYYCPHCVLPSTIVSGYYKEIKDLKVNETCESFEGETTIEEVYSRYFEGEILEIKATGILPFSITLEHPILVSEAFKNRKEQRLNYKLPFYKEVKDIIPRKGKYGNYLVIPKIKGKINDKVLSLKPFTNERGIWLSKGGKFRLDLILNNEIAWLMGLYVAEGSYSHSGPLFSLGEHEVKLKRKLREVIKKYRFSSWVKTKNGASTIGIYSRLLARAFKQWFGSGAVNKSIPEFIFYHIDKTLLNSFLNGYIDGDGYKFIRGKLKNIVAKTVSKTLALQLQMLCFRLDKVCSLRIHIPKDNFICGRKVNTKLQYIIEYYDNAENKGPIRILEDIVVTPVNKVKKRLYKGKVMNLKTKSGTYLINNITVHNCGMSIAQGIHDNTWTKADIRKVRRIREEANKPRTKEETLKESWEALELLRAKFTQKEINEMVNRRWREKHGIK